MPYNINDVIADLMVTAEVETFKMSPAGVVLGFVFGIAFYGFIYVGLKMIFG